MLPKEARRVRDGYGTGHDGELNINLTSDPAYDSHGLLLEMLSPLKIVCE